MADPPPPLPVASPTWEISARMSPWYCLPCPSASMPARNSFLSWISFTTRRGRRAVRLWGSRGPAGSWRGVAGGQEVASLRERKQFCGQTAFLTLTTDYGPLHTPHPSISGPSVAYILQSGPAWRLSPPVALEGAFFSIPLSPSQWQKYFGVFASLSPDLL